MAAVRLLARPFCAILHAEGRCAEDDMKKFSKIAMALALSASVATPAMAAPVCLTTYLIDSTKIVDAKTILFKMKNGTVWRNNLRSPCIGLRFNGFQYVLHTLDICDAAVSIRVLRTNEVCMLGTFTKVETSHT
jgi:hypothetical protein